MLTSSGRGHLPLVSQSPSTHDLIMTGINDTSTGVTRGEILQLLRPDDISNSECRSIIETLQDVEAVDEDYRVRPGHYADTESILEKYCEWSRALLEKLRRHFACEGPTP